MAKSPNTTVEELLEHHDQEQRIAFETIKSSMCHKVKVLGDAEFVIEMLEKNIDYYWEKK